MTSVSHLVVPSLTGCVLVASLVFGYPDRLRRPGTACGRRATLGHRRATILVPLPGADRSGVLVRQALAGRPTAAENAMIGIN
jgi:hypothetical protein